MHTRRDFLGAAAAPALQTARRKPNIIVLFTDDQGGGDLGCYGARDLKTPHIDELAASGARFTNWYSNAPVCAPSRAALMTGRYPQRAGVPGNGPPLTQRQRGIATLLKPRGYRTALTGKWHLGNSDDTCPNAHGFDHFYGFHSGCVDFYSHIFYWGESGARRIANYHDLYRNRTEIFEDGQYLTERITAEAKQFIQSARNEPFFLYCAYNAPHYPMHAPEKYKRRFPGMERERQTYAAMLAAIDDGVGEIRDTLKKSGQLENTLIFFVADNGATTEERAGLEQRPATAGSNGPYRGFKFSLFDGGMHVPGIMSWPGTIPAGQTINEVVMTMDVLPTACAAAGASIPGGHVIDGRNILPVASQRAASPHETIYWESGGQQAARRGSWKLVVDGNPRGRSAEERKPLSGEDGVFLSDLSKDPGERVNLRRVHPNVVDEMMTGIQRWKAGLASNP